METKIKASAVVIGGLTGSFFGGWDALLYALLTAIAIDYVTGLLLATSTRKLSSAVGFAGICKKVFMLFLVALAHLVDSAIIGSGAVVRNAVILFYFANEGLSIIENSAQLGLPVPDKLKEILAQLREDTKEDKKGEKEKVENGGKENENQ